MIEKLIHFCFCLLMLWSAEGQDIYDARQSVIADALVQDSPPQIKLNWRPDTANGGYTIWRKSLYDSIWRDSLVSLPNSATGWIDSQVIVSHPYEYQILKRLPRFPYADGTPNFGSSYLLSGIKVAPVHHTGSCLLVIENNLKFSLAKEILLLVADLEHEGWSVDTIYVNKNDSVNHVKYRISSWALNNTDLNRAVFLLGRVPVPYSGFIATDGHHSDHKGAWPADAYYATVQGIWTDHIVNSKAAADARNDNVPGDGKFDNNIFPAPVELQIGRVDFSNMNKFPEPELELLKRYLNKNHAWRTGKNSSKLRGLVDNNYPLDLEALGQTAWRNFSAMFGNKMIEEQAYRQTLSKNSYLWSYGCGGGGPESASDISNTGNFTSDSLQHIFTMLFGSYFGDWDYPNNFLRAAIASRTGLISVWGNRPCWFFHHMALGNHIGYSVQLSMNNRGMYVPKFYGGYVSMALMGDPTIKMHIVNPAKSLLAKQEGLNVRLSWQMSHNDSLVYIYKKYAEDKSFQLISAQPTADTTYYDTCLKGGIVHYMIRVVTLTNSGSGTYYNLSAGVSTQFLVDTNLFKVELKVIHGKEGNPNGEIEAVPSGSCSPYMFHWDNGNTSSKITNLRQGRYCVTISDCSSCSVVRCAEVQVNTLVQNTIIGSGFLIFPDPTLGKLTLICKDCEPQICKLDIIDIYGRKWNTYTYFGNSYEMELDVSYLPSGSYILHLSGHTKYRAMIFNKL